VKGTAGATDHDSANRKPDNALRSSMEIREAAGASQRRTQRPTTGRQCRVHASRERTRA